MTTDELKAIQKELIRLKAAVNKELGPRISKKAIRQQAEFLSTRWFRDAEPSLSKQPAIGSEVLEAYGFQFKKLLKLSNPNNHQDSYLEVLSAILKSFRDDLVLPIQTSPQTELQNSPLESMLMGIASTDKDQYFIEAAHCARHKLLRAAAVMGWCTCIDRIHKTIERIGYDRFNLASQAMAAQNGGRFKRFNSPQRVTSMAEMREVFDSNVLWILEGMQLIDNNQHTRLKSCFDLRCQSAHPGDAPVTEYNLMSFFSDIDEIVFKNPKFTI